MMCEYSIKCGDRVALSEERGTVGYIGEVDGYNGLWIGIDWDSSERGKHNGTINGRTYFIARCERSGSFIRPALLTYGKSIIVEMAERYQIMAVLDEHVIGNKEVELIAMDKIHMKQRDLWKLRCIVLDNMCVAYPPPTGTLSFHLCTELNLYNNLISSWSKLLELLEYFPSLLYLNLRMNKMRPIDPLSLEQGYQVKSPVSLLVLSDCEIDLFSVEIVVKIFPFLKELHLSRNNFQSFDINLESSLLEVLDLEGNPFDNFNKINNLANLNSLNSLNIANCGLRTLMVNSDKGFKALRSLDVRNNHLVGWQWIKELSQLPSLSSLFYKCFNCDTLMGLDFREILIAKLPNLVELDRCSISDVERRSCEIRFLSAFSKQPIAIEHVDDIERLKRVHGEPLVGTNISQKIELLNVKLVFEDRIVEKILPASITVQALMGLLKRIFGLGTYKVQLCATSDYGNHVIPLDSLQRSLNFYSVANGDTLLISTAD